MPFGAVPPCQWGACRLAQCRPPLSRRSRICRKTPVACGTVVVVDWALCLWYAGCVFMGDCGKLWEILRYCAFSKHLKISQKFPKILIIPSSTRPVCVPHSVNIRKHPYHFRKKMACAVCRGSVHRLCFFGMLCRTPGRKPPCFLPSPLFPGFSRASSETLDLSRKVIAPAFTGRLPLAVFPFTRGLLLALRSSSQLLVLGFCS